MVNTQLLDERIDSSGLKIAKICENLGLSRNGFDKKRKGKTAFRGSEIYALCVMLNIADDKEKTKIFYPESSLVSELRG